MEAVDPREDEMEDISYEVGNDLLIGYATSLLASPIDKNKKILGTYQEIIGQVDPSDKKAEKNKKVVQASTFTPIGT